MAGFTLIELMVALLIFGLLASAGVMLLTGSVNAQGAVKQHLDDMALVQRASAAMTADLAQALPRISRNAEGNFVPAFWGQGETDRPLILFVRGGWSNLGDAPRPTLQKIEYWLEDGRLVRIAYPMLDGAEPGEPAPLLEDVVEVAFRYRDHKGAWRDDWQPSQPDLLPKAVEMRVTRAAHAPLTLLFIVGPGARPAREREAGR